MKTSELLSKLDLSKKEKYYIDHDFLSEFDFNLYDIDTDKINLECIRIITWYCTDSWVGIKVILLDDNPICVSTQQGRKCDENFEWISKEAYLKMKKIVEQAKIENEKSISLLNLEEEFGEYYKISFADELIPRFHKSAFFKGERVLVEKIPTENYVETKVKIKFENGNFQIVELEQLNFPLMGLI